jgi:hypothetical protein
VNYKYLGISILFLIITYYYLHDTKIHIHKKEINNSHKTSIKVETAKGEILMDPNIFEMHMTRLKDNIINLHKNFKPDDCPKLKKYLKNAKVKTNAYINVNTKDTKPSFCDINEKNKILDDYVLQERELLKNKLSNKTEKDDDETIDSDNMRYQLLELIIDIDIILFLIRASLCKKGSLDLSCLDSVILELYRTKCSDQIPEFSQQSNYNTESFQGCETEKCGINNPSPYYMDYYDPNVHTRLGIRPEHISRCVPSQNIDDTNSMPIKESFEQKRINYNASDSSQSKEKEFKCNEVRLGKQLNYADCYRNGLEWFAKYDLADTGKQVDTSSRSCLLESL